MLLVLGLLLVSALLLLVVLILPLLLGPLLLLPVLVLLLLGLLLLLGFLLLRSPLLFRPVLFFVLLILLSVTQGRGSEKHKQNCCADDSNAFHECCLDISLRAAGVINCLLLTRALMASDLQMAGARAHRTSFLLLSFAVGSLTSVM